MKTSVAADHILRYYRALDAYTETSEYHRQLDNVTQILLEKFDKTHDADGSPFVKLFYLVVNLKNSAQELDAMGGEECARELHNVYLRVDANLRECVSRLTDEDVRRDQIFDEDFVNQMLNCGDVISLDSYRPRKRLQNQG